MTSIYTNDNPSDSNQTQIEIPPSADIPVSIPDALFLPHWLLAILLASAISKHLYQTAVVVLEITRLWKKPAVDKPKTE